MVQDGWSVMDMQSYKSRTPEEIDVLWSSDLPAHRDVQPALWDGVIGFFEDAIVASCSRPGKLVVTPRELLKQMKHKGREPSSGMRVITELFRRGDIMSADTLKPASAESSTTSAYSLGGIRSTLTRYLWSPKKSAALSLDDPIVPVAALKAAAARISALSGPMASADIHTVKSFATAITAENARDAEAVIAHLVAKGDATALYTDPTDENPDPVLGVKLGKGNSSPADKGVLRTKAALENMQQLSSHLESQISSEKEAATIAAKAGNKGEALSRLRKKKALEAKLTGARSAAVKLTEVLMAVDEAESNKEAVLALETGMSSLKLATEGGVTADRVDAVAADFKELMEGQNDTRLALEQLGQESAGDDALLEQELEDLITGEICQPSGAAPPVPTQKTLADEAEEELAELLQSLPTPSKVEVQDPQKAAVQNAEKLDGVAQTSGGQSRNVTAPNV